MRNNTIKEMLMKTQAEQSAFLTKIGEIEHDVLALAYEAEEAPSDERIEQIETALAAARQLQMFARSLAVECPIDDPTTTLQFVMSYEFVDELAELVMAHSGAEPTQSE